MSLGKMTEMIQLVQVTYAVDQAGFANRWNQQLVATVRAYVEARHATSAWVNRAAYTKATTLFRFRVIPGVEVFEDMEIQHGHHRYKIDSVEMIRSRYVEVLAHRTEAEGDPTKRRG